MDSHIFRKIFLASCTFNLHYFGLPKKHICLRKTARLPYKCLSHITSSIFYNFRVLQNEDYFRDSRTKLLEIFTDILLITKVQKIAVRLKYAYHNFD